MKLKQLLQLLFEAGHFKDNILGPDILSKFKHHIMTCDEFRYVDTLEIPKTPVFKDITGKVLNSEQRKLTDDLEFEGTCYIYSIAASPILYNPDDMHKPVSNGACISPITYDPHFFIPKRKICIEFDVDAASESDNVFDYDKKNELLKIFTDVLNSPEKYIHLGYREFIIRGII